MWVHVAEVRHRMLDQRVFDHRECGHREQHGIECLFGEGLRAGTS